MANLPLVINKTIVSTPHQCNTAVSLEPNHLIPLLSTCMNLLPRVSASGGIKTACVVPISYVPVQVAGFLIELESVYQEYNLTCTSLSVHTLKPACTCNLPSSKC